MLLVDAIQAKGAYSPFWQSRIFFYIIITPFKMKYTGTLIHTQSSHFTSSQLGWPCQCVGLWGDVAMWFRLNTLHWLIGVRAAEHVMDRHKHTHTASTPPTPSQHTHTAPPSTTQTHREHVFSEGQTFHLSWSPLPCRFSKTVNLTKCVCACSHYSIQSSLKHSSTCLLCMSFPV